MILHMADSMSKLRCQQELICCLLRIADTLWKTSFHPVNRVTDGNVWRWDVP